MGISTPYMQLRNKAVLVYYLPEQFTCTKFISFRRGNMAQQQRQQYSGRLSPGAKKRLTKAITLLVQATKPRFIYNEVTKRMFFHKLSFITLTVSDPTRRLDGKTAYKKLLSHFLQWFRRTQHVKTYLWKAELQRNGQLHYHITTPAFIHWQKVRDKWNNLQRKAGLLTRYAEEHGHYNANSTDVHEVESIKDMAGYLVKEIAKQCQNETSLGGKVWDCSENLSAAKYFTLKLTEDHHKFMKYAAWENLAEEIVHDRFTLVKFREPPEEHILSKEELQHFRTHLQAIMQTV